MVKVPSCASVLFIVFFCVWFLFFNEGFGVLSIFLMIMPRKEELVALHVL